MSKKEERGLVPSKPPKPKPNHTGGTSPPRSPRKPPKKK